MEKAQKLLEQLQQHGTDIIAKVKDFIREVIGIIFPNTHVDAFDFMMEDRDLGWIVSIVKAKLDEIIAKLKELIEQGKGVAGEVCQALLFP